MSLMHKIHLCRSCEEKFRPKALVEVVLVDDQSDCVFSSFKGFDHDYLNSVLEVR